MRKKHDDEFDSDEDLENARLFEKVSQVIRADPKNMASNLEKLGFAWVDDGYGDVETAEEKAATPQNVLQEYLVNYFGGYLELENEVLHAFQIEKNSEDPNYPLIRSYFKQGNLRLKRLLLFGLQLEPTNINLLSDLAFFHEFRPLLQELVACYLTACQLETNLQAFETLVNDFYLSTEPDGFDAFYALEPLFPADSEKGKVLQRIRHGKASDMEDIEF